MDRRSGSEDRTFSRRRREQPFAQDRDVIGECTKHNRHINFLRDLSILAPTNNPRSASELSEIVHDVQNSTAYFILHTLRFYNHDQKKSA
jgi:hypothetical protein